MNAFPLLACLVAIPLFHAQDLSLPLDATAGWSCLPPSVDAAKAPRLFGKDLQEDQREDWRRPGLDLVRLNAGCTFTNGMLSWSDLPNCPTLTCRKVPADWTPWKGLELTIRSRLATRDLISIGVLADDPQTTFDDYLTTDLVVDWTGEKTLVLPFASFTPYGSPQAWKGITALGLYARAKRQSPDPRTSLEITSVRLVATVPKDVPPAATTAAAIPAGPAFDPLLARYYDLPTVPNHGGPEVLRPLRPGTPIVEEHAHRGARALYGYHPWYTPGYVSFDPQGRPFIRTLTAIQWLDATGRWQTKDLLPALRAYCQANAITAFTIGDHDSDLQVRFDKDGDIYVLVELKCSSRCTLLLHARGVEGAWQCHRLPGTYAAFENADGNNPDALANPPVLTVKEFHHFHGTERNAYLVVPEKRADGTLVLPQPVAIGIGKNELVMVGPHHDGRGSNLVSFRDRIVIAYGSVPLANDPKKPWSKPDDPAWRDSLGIPAGHPAEALMVDPVRGTGDARPANGGAPQFVQEYNRTTRTMGTPVFIGYGGTARDAHNWPAITIDSTGVFHAIVIGHCDPVYYTRSVAPWDISRWTVQTPITRAPDSTYACRASYPSLSCDRHDNLLFVFRSDTGTYNHRLSAIGKKAGQPWGTERSVLVPSDDYYHAWGHQVAYNRTLDRHFLSFQDGWPTAETPTLDLFYRHFFPFAGQSPKGTKTPTTAKDSISRASEAVMLWSGDVGASWSFATTPDFLQNPP